MGGADVIRQVLRADRVDELSIPITPITPGAGKRLFGGFDLPMRFEPVAVLQSRWATLTTYPGMR